MKFVSASSIIISSICLVLLPASASAQCAATREIAVPEKDSITTIPCVRNGPVVFIWETTGELDDDEYFITLEQNGVEIYSSGNSEIVGTASDQSSLVGTPGNGDYVIRFRCDLEGLPFITVSCDAADLQYNIVDCGCPEGFLESEACNLDSLDAAADAVCIPINTPTTSPTDMPTTDTPVTDAEADGITDAEADDSGGLSGGAIAGMAVGGAVLLMAATFWGTKAFYGGSGSRALDSKSEIQGDSSATEEYQQPNSASSVPTNNSRPEIGVVEQVDAAQPYLPDNKDQCRSVALGDRNCDTPLANAVLIEEVIVDSDPAAKNADMV